MKISLAGLGTALPANQAPQQLAADFASSLIREDDKHARVLKKLYRQSGVASRSSVLLRGTSETKLIQDFYPASSVENRRGPSTSARMQRYEQDAPQLAITAARHAFVDAQIDADQITHLVTVSCTGFSSPGVEFRLIEELGLSETVARTNLGFMGCHGAINGLRVAQAFAASNQEARVLVCAVELCSLHLQYGWHPDWIVSNALFADGAAAAILSSQPSNSSPITLAATASKVFPGTEQEMSWKVGDFGFEMSLSPRVPEVISDSLRPWLIAWLATHDLTIDQIQGWAVHPGGPRILQACEEALELPCDAMDVSREILSSCGNMSSPTVLFILERFRQENRHLPWVSLAFGPGLVAEAALFTGPS